MLKFYIANSVELLYNRFGISIHVFDIQSHSNIVYKLVSVEYFNTDLVCNRQLAL